ARKGVSWRWRLRQPPRLPGQGPRIAQSKSARKPSLRASSKSAPRAPAELVDRPARRRKQLQQPDRRIAQPRAAQQPRDGEAAALDQPQAAALLSQVGARGG